MESLHFSIRKEECKRVAANILAIRIINDTFIIKKWKLLFYKICGSEMSTLSTESNSPSKARN